MMLDVARVKGESSPVERRCVFPDGIAGQSIENAAKARAHGGGPIKPNTQPQCDNAEKEPASPNYVGGIRTHGH
eukprot:CAMPEP_0170204094 /NCGR_PEP_ID=MMETSP0116_2-20130129/1565_1 /TAXON_ID=400756 /ORGANISM="Durinskia baltica, Strain CSIRO CS-38" /LENGTH=73 /DNA_ID=CAMNT_0010454433 /DNA_START=75 /DNA_END=296 /DNA_ORIENTATION=+